MICGNTRYMEVIRKGNDLEILWAIYTGEGYERTPYDLDGKDLSFFLVGAYGRERKEDIVTEGNVLRWMFRGKDQKESVYSLELVINDGQDGMRSVDLCDAFRLVGKNCEVHSCPAEDVELQYLQFSSSLGFEFIEVVDRLDSEDTTAALSANQGRVLKEMIDGGITEEKEVYIGTTPTDDAKIWIDPTGTPSGGGSTAEPELRPLYVPDLNATLTDEQMAYNEETCQKMLEGTAIAVVTNGEMSSYSDSIIDLTPQGAEGYVVSFKGVGGVYVIGGDVMVILPDVSTSATIPEDIAAENAADITNLVIAISIAGSLGSFPACYLGKGDIRHLFQECGASMGVLVLSIEYYDYSTRVVSTYLLAGDGRGGDVITFRYPTKIYLTPFPSDTEKKANVDWMKTRHGNPREVPTLKYDIEYHPISINRYSSNTGYADFTIYRDGAFETWRMMDDGSTTKL
jgi:hypothetical protein